MTVLKIGVVLFVAVLLSAPVIAQEQAGGDDPWEMVRALEGVWKGDGAGFGQTSRVTHDWQFVLGGKFLRLETRSVNDGPSGEGEVHEDVGYVSWSEGDGVLRFRQFLSEGYVNSFTLDKATPPDAGFNCEPVGTDGMETFSVRMTLRFKDDDTYEMVLEMGTKGEELEACQTMRLKKVN